MYSLHGYSSGAIEGNSYYHVGIEYLRPVGWDWLRVLAVADALTAFKARIGDKVKLPLAA